VVLYVIFEVNIIRMRRICLRGLLVRQLCNTMWLGFKVESGPLIGFLNLVLRHPTLSPFFYVTSEPWHSSEYIGILSVLFICSGQKKVESNETDDIVHWLTVDVANCQGLTHLTFRTPVDRARNGIASFNFFFWARSVKTLGPHKTEGASLSFSHRKCWCCSCTQ
jgi:hypothetical protein